MAFQPFQLSKPTGMDSLTSGMDSFGNSLVQAQQMQRAREQQQLQNLRNAAQDKRQAQSDYQSALLQAQKLAAAGDLRGAQALMAPYGAQIQQREAPEETPWAAQLNPTEIDTVEHIPFRPQGSQQGAPADPRQIEPPPFNPQAAAGSPPVNSLVAAAQADKAKQKRMVSYLTGRGPNGETWSLDPEAQRFEQQQRADEAFAKAGGEGGDMGDIVRELYPQMRASAAAAGSPLDANESMRYMQGEARMRASDRAAMEREKQRLEAEDRRNAEWYERLKAAEIGRNKRAALTAASRPDIETKGIEKKQKALNIEQDYETSVQKVLQNYRYADLRQGRGKLLDLATAVAGSGENAALAAIAAGAFTKAAQGGTGIVSDNDLRVFWERIGGVGVRTEQAFRNAINGQLGPEKQKIVQDAVNAMIGASDRRADEIGQAIGAAVGRLPGGQERLPGLLKVYVPSYAARLEAQEKRAKAASQPGGDPRERYQRILRGEEQ